MVERPALVKKNLKALSDQAVGSYNNSLLDTVNDHGLRMSVMTGEYRWHYHANTDELFIQLEGELQIEIKGAETILLKPGEFVTIPKGTIHKTSARGRSVNLCFERQCDDTVFVSE
jgi:mannose-6-phosphate isomerase-like protein (cupin superfamily)